jgi:hypothetical protein
MIPLICHLITLNNLIVFQGVIDAAVNGGIAKYQEAFFTQNFFNEFPNHLLHVAKLQKLMMEQVLPY